ncbi:integrase [Bordetella trematum]|uniref:integrase n=1 Tax=Bordetella trematum TaxID=123899 RepID=UPI0013FDF388|nr:integrase [Bordetella trematum]
MSAPILLFTPQLELEPSANVDAFIDLCRHSKIWNADMQFDKNVWDVGYQKGQNKVLRAIFSTLEAAECNASEPVLPQPFLDFAKATLIYLQDTRPVASPVVRVAALRCLEAALRKCSKGSRPTAVNEEVLDSAVELARKQVSSAVAYRIAGQLRHISDFMQSKGFITLRQRWFHGLKKPQETGTRFGAAHEKARQEKLPSAARLRALGGIFYQAVEVPDVVISSNAALMLCAPERINEVLRFRRNCIVEGEGEFRGKLGLRWSGSKGFDDTTKWIPSEMQDIARQAVRKLTSVSEPAQRLAAWYTENPTQIYLHEGALHLRGKAVLSKGEIALLLWGDDTATKQANTWATITHKLAKIPLEDHGIGFLFEDVERAVISMLPDTFPYMPGDSGLLCRDAMALIRVNEMHATRATYLCMFDCVDHGVVTNAFGGRGDRKSIFERFGYTEDDGSPIKLNSHSLRHYLNTLANYGELSSAEIAIFSGRKDVRQNLAYDHMTSQEVQAPISRALQAGFTAGLEPVADIPRNLVARSEFKGLGLTAAHTTEYGWCVHNFASEPCQMHRDCINCQEQVCVKGEDHRKRNLESLRAETEYLLVQAKHALSDDEYGADIWVKHQTLTLERVTKLLEILDDPSVPNGAEIQLDVGNVPLVTKNNVHSVRVFGSKQRRVEK